MEVTFAWASLFPMQRARPSHTHAAVAEALPPDARYEWP